MKSFLFLHLDRKSVMHRVAGKGKVCPGETWLPFKEITATVILLEVALAHGMEEYENGHHLAV